MIKETGKTYTQVAKLLKERGFGTEGLKIATLGRGQHHLVLIGDETVGEYNHRTDKLTLYRDIIQA